jgi:multisubunit Na+/H+ antiporter MnhG subunit
MEPSNETISDYNRLTGEKKRVVWAVILLCLAVGVGYTVAGKIFNAKNDSIAVQEKIVSNPFGVHVIPVK